MPKIRKAREATTWLQVPQFSRGAMNLRRHFDERFADPHVANSDRFVWDYWHIPKQYTLLRTPAYHFFPPPLYRSIHESLVNWGRQNLGCHDISLPWLSCYVEGCRQELHGDLPHGPWAFVFSLTPWKSRRFSGGETTLLKPEVLNFWSNFRNSRGMELDDISIQIPPHFNALTVFDPRIPHGVRPVHGVHDPRQGRLVIHGWFVQPRPFIRGHLSRNQVDRGLIPLHEAMADQLAQLEPVTGTLPFRLQIAPNGSVRRVSWMPHTLRSAHPEAAATILKTTSDVVKDLKFARVQGATTATVPLIFQVD